MANGVFVITELPSAGDPAVADLGERFEWTADSKPSAPFDGMRGGGARACPLKPWHMGTEHHTVRTDYPNAIKPSEQMLGPRKKPQVFKGYWDDRYNGHGYAEAELARFEAMVDRGNGIRWQYGTQVFEGVITSFDPEWRAAWRIEYEFTVSVHGRAGATDPTRVPITPPDTSTSLDNFDLAVQAMLDADDLAPRHAIAGSLADDVTEILTATVDNRETLAATIDQRDLAPPEQPIDAFTRIATQFRTGRDTAFSLLARLEQVRADSDMATQTAMSVLDFEDWIRSLRWSARIAMGAALTGDRAATERAEPDARRLYRPQTGEHLYAISRKFYGTPHGWKLIYDRNALASFTMDGTEMLIIPERGGV